MGTNFWKEGLAVVPSFLSDQESEGYCRTVLALDRDVGLPLIERRERERSLRYKVVDGLKIAEALPDIDLLTLRVASVLERVCGPGLVLMDDPIAARNINVTPPGGEYRWHYDRNAVTAVVYLNETPGGETEIFANFRILTRGRPRLQRRIDDIFRLRPVRRLFGRLKVVTPKRGTLLIMKGDTALHSVRAVLGDRDRIAVVLAFDYEGQHRRRDALNEYLYTGSDRSDKDPNYIS
jgi:2OG-Fe(II) oxygenase superfamily